MERIADNLKNIQKRIEAACFKSGRKPEEITLVAVSKRKPAADIISAYNIGLRQFGENTPQELRDKVKEIGLSEIKWHFIGHLQSNKIKYVAPSAYLIHSVDSFKLAESIDQWLEKNGTGEKVKALIQVKTAKEESKAGVSSDSFFLNTENWLNLRNLQFCGVMTMATNTDQEEEIRRCFKTAKLFYDKLIEGNFFQTDRTWLSMGMTDDFELAIEEGANMLRIGSAIFGKRK